ncbi:DNA polymerase zeta [Gaertneriomyces sp. JEL0708]|nr:DNA polymerase zeta [Gaertneriomyces sp. JEL0708]
MASPDPLISVRLLSLDHYLATPTEYDVPLTQFAPPNAGRLTSVLKVPVIRVFGVTETGQKCCLHVHDCYPYIFVEYNGAPEDDVNAYCYHLGTSINHALSLSTKGDPSTRPSQIASVTLTKGIPFYGFHSSYRPFLKISFVNPHTVQRAVTLLQNGAIMGRKYKVYEAHLPYLHQWMLDYDIYGCEGIMCRGGLFRMPVLDVPHVVPSVYTESSIPPMFHWPSDICAPPRQSYCELELDVWARDIMNRSRIKERARKPLINTLPDDQNGMVIHVPSLASIWEDERARRTKNNGGSVTVGDANGGVERVETIPWRNEAKLREQLMDAVKTKLGDSVPTFTVPAWEDDSIPTAFQYVQAYDPDEDVQEEYVPSQKPPSQTSVDWSQYFGTIDPHVDMERVAVMISQGEKELVDVLAGLANENESEVGDDVEIPYDTSSEYGDVDSVFGERSPESEAFGTPRSGRSGPPSTPMSGRGPFRQSPLSRTPSNRHSRTKVFPVDSLIDMDANAETDLESSPTLRFSNRKRVATPKLSSHIHPPLPFDDAYKPDDDESLPPTPTKPRPGSQKLPQLDGAWDSQTSDTVSHVSETSSEREHESKNNTFPNSEDDPDSSPPRKLSGRRARSIPDFSDDESEELSTSGHSILGKRKRLVFSHVEVPRKRTVVSRSGSVLAERATVEERTRTDIAIGDQCYYSELSSRTYNGAEIIKSFCARQDTPIPIDEVDAEERDLPHLRREKGHKVNVDEDLIALMQDSYKNKCVNDEIDDEFDFLCTQGMTEAPTDVESLNRSPVRLTLSPVRGTETENPLSAPSEHFDSEPDTRNSQNDITVSPERHHFTASIQTMWSPSTPVRPRKVFFESPPVVGTPSRALFHRQQDQRDIEEIRLLGALAEAELDEGVFSDESATHEGDMERSVDAMQQDGCLPGPIKQIESHRAMDDGSHLQFLGEPEVAAVSQQDIDMLTSSQNEYWTCDEEEARSSPPLQHDQYLASEDRDISPLIASMTERSAPVEDNLLVSETQQNARIRQERQMAKNEVDPFVLATRSVDEDANELELAGVLVESITKEASVANDSADANSSLNDLGEEGGETSQFRNRDTIPSPSTIGDNSQNEPLCRVFQPLEPPPTYSDLLESDIPNVVYREPYYSNPKDVPNHPISYAGREFRFVPEDARRLKEFNTAVRGKLGKYSLHVMKNQVKIWTRAEDPPSVREATEWVTKHPPGSNLNPRYSRDTDMADEAILRKDVGASQLDGPTPPNTYGFKFSQINTDMVSYQKTYLCLMSLEIHASTRDDLLPDPAKDPVHCIVYCMQCQDEKLWKSQGHRPGYYVGIIAIQDQLPLNKCAIRGYPIDYVSDERGLFERLVQKVRAWDPDILLGYEIHNASWGYLIERAEHGYKIDLCKELSRVMPDYAKTRFGDEDDEWGSRKQSYIHTTGRIFLNVWRLMRAEMDLTSYTIENMVYHVLHRRVPHYTAQTLMNWYKTSARSRWRTVKYYIDRVQWSLSLLDDMDIISRTCEFARVFGVDFYSVITRGSQFKVEAIMSRIVKPENFMMVSPSRRDVAQQRACECLPLVMEPISRLYTSPVIVLDFQSLYPSVMIAYNYCYSTCLGRVQSVGEKHQLGVLDDYEVSADFVQEFKDHLNISPNGLAFVKPHIREGVLRRMLTELLDTRVMVKQSMKLYRTDRSLLRILDARQLGLKFLANVTYGYTGASFSGRMPCVDIADAIVQTGRATLERAIDLIESTDKWGAKVVYGDTDSLFVSLEGRSKDDAFRIAKEIVQEVSKREPAPVLLKFEKVYHPCVLLAKKRYVGFKYESPTDTEPEFDAKGIETVRRDGCPAVRKIMEAALKILFRTTDLSLVKKYLVQQWRKILEGHANLKDFIIAKEVKLGTYSARGPPPPGAVVAMKQIEKDPRAAPQYGERVPYVVVYREPGARLVDSAVGVEDHVVKGKGRLHAIYYITKMIIPALSRIFSLVGADLKSWFHEMPRIREYKPDLSKDPRNKGKGPALDYFYAKRKCAICGVEVSPPPLTGFDQAKLPADDIPLCNAHAANLHQTRYDLAYRTRKTQSKKRAVWEVCRSCVGGDIEAAAACIEKECEVFYERWKVGGDKWSW